MDDMHDSHLMACITCVYRESDGKKPELHLYLNSYSVSLNKEPYFFIDVVFQQWRKHVKVYIGKSRRSIGYESITRKVVHMRVYEKLDMDLALKCDS
jgi:hypothetical protein